MTIFYSCYLRVTVMISSEGSNKHNQFISTIRNYYKQLIRKLCNFSANKAQTITLKHLIKFLQASYSLILLYPHLLYHTFNIITKFKNVHEDFRSGLNVLSLITIKKMIDFIASCARQYLTFHNIAWHYARLFAFTSFYPFLKQIRGFISCFQLENLHKAVNFKKI